MADGSAGDAPLSSIWIDCVKGSHVLLGRRKFDGLMIYFWWNL